MRRRRYLPIAFDRDAHLVDVAKQAAVSAELKALGISFESLRQRLLTDKWNQHIYEYVAMKRELKLRDIDPLLRQLERVLSSASDDETGLLTARFFAAADRLRAAAEVMHDELMRQLGAAGHAWAESSHDRAAGRRRVTGSPVRREPSTPRGIRRYLESLRRHLMPAVRVQLYETLYPAIERRAGGATSADGRRDPDVEKEARRRTHALAGKFIQAFYPTLSRSNESELVRKTVHVAGGSFRGNRRARPGQ